MIFTRHLYLTTIPAIKYNDPLVIVSNKQTKSQDFNIEDWTLKMRLRTNKTFCDRIASSTKKYKVFLADTEP